MTDRVPPDPIVPPSPPDDEIDAALGLLGLGDGVPNAAARELIARATAGVALAGAPAPETIVPVAPPAGLRARLLDRIRREQRFQFVHADEGHWTALPSGGHAKLLYDGGRPGERTRLLRLPAGDADAALADAHDPALLVVEGELWRADVRCVPGDFAQAVPNETPPSWRAASPATVLVLERGSMPRTARRAPVVPAGTSGWRTMAPGTRVRPLAGGASESVDVMLLEMDAGAVLPEHEHGGLEEIFLLRGSCRAQGRSIRAGDYHRAAHGSEHEDTTTDEGCLMLVVLRKAA